jgi:hypothetical protein
VKTIILYIAPLLFFVHSNAQQSFTNNGNLQIHTGASVYGFGTFTNTSTGALVNNGSLYIKGDISNSQASMANGTGTLYLKGTAAQSLNGTQTLKTFNLVTDNSTGITLNNSLSVSNIHTFTSGIITTSVTPYYLIYETGSSYSGDGDTKHVNGWVKKIGSTNFSFPTGNGTAERKIAIGSLSVSSEFNAKYFAITPFSNQMQSPFWDIDDTEYWTLNKISGGTATVTMNWDHSKVYFPNWATLDIQVAGYDGIRWVPQGGPASGSTATTGTVTSGSVSTFNIFTFGSSSYILPLTQINFIAKRENHITHLAWTTAGELTMNRFVTERSDDAVHFYTIGEYTARNTGSTENYTGIDDRSINGFAYYRLRSIDNNSKEQFSRVVTVSDAGINNLLSLLINPVNDYILLRASANLNGLFDYSITCVNGQFIQQGKLNIQNGGQYKLALKENILPGPYLLIVSNSLQSFHFKVIKN